MSYQDLLEEDIWKHKARIRELEEQLAALKGFEEWRQKFLNEQAMRRQAEGRVNHLAAVLRKYGAKLQEAARGVNPEEITE